MPKITQVERVLRHLKEVGSINPAQAITEYGIYRLAAVIFILREAGHSIDTDFAHGRNRYDEPVHWAVYSLQKGEFQTSLF